MLVHLEGLSPEQRAQLPKLKVMIDRTGMVCHDFDGFSLHLPGLIVTRQGTAIAVSQKQHDSMGDCGHPIDILMSRSENGGKTWQHQEVIFEEQDNSAILGPIFEVRAAGAVFVAFYKMPVEVVNNPLPLHEWHEKRHGKNECRAIQPGLDRHADLRRQLIG